MFINDLATRARRSSRAAIAIAVSVLTSAVCAGPAFASGGIWGRYAAPVNTALPAVTSSNLAPAIPPDPCSSHAMAVF
jgi:hypothetical protein